MDKAAAVALIVCAAALWLPRVSGAGKEGDARTHSVRDGVYTDRQADRGQPLYHEHCERCHGEDLDGEEAPALADSEFLADWKGHTLGDVFERIRVAMPGDHPGLLTNAQSADVLALILRANGFPSGERELKGDTSALREIRIEPPATRPKEPAGR